MAEQKIERIEDVREGDVVTLHSDELGADISARTTYIDRDEVARPPVTRFDLTLGVMGHSTPIHVSDVGSWRFVSATREVPEIAPGTPGTATVRGVEGVRVMRTERGYANRPWTSAAPVGGAWSHSDGEVVGFVPDDRAVLGKAFDDLTERWKRQNAEIDRLRAALAEVQGDLETQVQITRDVRADANSLLQQKDQWYAAAVQAEAEVNRLAGAADILGIVHTVQTRGGVGDVAGVRIERLVDGETITARKLAEARAKLAEVRQAIQPGKECDALAAVKAIVGGDGDHVHTEVEATEHGDRPKRRFVCTVCGTEQLTDGE